MRPLWTRCGCIELRNRRFVEVISVIGCIYDGYPNAASLQKTTASTSAHAIQGMSVLPGEPKRPIKKSKKRLGHGQQQPPQKRSTQPTLQTYYVTTQD